MISNEKIKSIIDEAKNDGRMVNVTDISFVLLSSIFSDVGVAYRCLFRNTDENAIKRYSESETIKYLKKLVLKSSGVMVKNKNGYDEVSFEENKQGIVDLIKDTEEALEKKEISKKDGLKILADLRVKLTEKFNIQGEQIEQMVVVEPKFNSICKCGREIYIPTKEDMMKIYNLVENKN